MEILGIALALEFVVMKIMVLYWGHGKYSYSKGRLLIGSAGILISSMGWSLLIFHAPLIEFVPLLIIGDILFFAVILTGGSRNT